MNSQASRPGGFAFLRILLLLSVTGLAAWLGYRYQEERRFAEEASANLRQVYAALENYEMGMGRLPQLAFFPDNPLEDPDSLLVVLARYGITPAMLTCPGAPASIRSVGLNYVWNVSLNKKKLLEPGERKWMLVNLHALSSRVPPPHLGRYSVLYTDGQVEFTEHPPAEIVQR